MNNLKEKAYHAVKGKIISCEFAPGSFINESLLMQELDMSRTPIREALSKLDQEGFLEILSKRGVLVRGLSMTDISQTFEARLLLEPFIVRNYAHQIDRQTLFALREETLQLIFSPEPTANGAEVYFCLDDRIHRAICDACPNIYFRCMLTHIYDQSIRIRNMLKNRSRHMDSCKEHILILDAILAGDAESAERFVTEHLLHSKDMALRSLSSQDIRFL